LVRLTCYALLVTYGVSGALEKKRELKFELELEPLRFMSEPMNLKCVRACARSVMHADRHLYISGLHP